MKELKPIKEGKVREIYDNGDSLIMVATDRISCFDVILNNEVTKKGTVLTQMSKFWFDLTEDILPNHMISVDVKDMPEFFQQDKFDGNSMLCRKLEMLPIECIVRGYITGSGWASYQENGTVCGIKLPEGLKESDKLPEPIYTPSTKAEIGDHDENISYEESKNRLYNIMVNEKFLSTANPYTDLGAMVLKEVVSKVTNQNFYDFVKENIIDKANMQKTSIFVNPQDLSYLAPTDNTIVYKNGEFIFRNIPLGTVNDEKAQILGQQANDFAGHAGLFSTSENMAKFAISLMKYDILSEKYLKSMSKNATGRFIEELNTYKQFFGQLCYSKNPNPKATEVYHPLSGTSFAMGGYTGNQFTLDPENNVFAFLGSNRTNNRVANISGFDKSKIKHFPNGKETILIGNKEYINSSSYSSKRDEALRCTLKLSLSYLFLEYYVNALENEIDLTGTYSRHI